MRKPKWGEWNDEEEEEGRGGRDQVILLISASRWGRNDQVKVRRPKWWEGGKVRQGASDLTFFCIKIRKKLWGQDEEAEMRRLRWGGWNEDERWGRDNVRHRICLAVQVRTFELLHIGTSFLAWSYILTISRSSLSIKVTESRSRSSAKEFIYLFLCMLLWAIYKVKVTHEGQSHTWRSRLNQCQGQIKVIF